MNKTVKICGMRETGNIIAAADLKPEILGFIFYPESPRFAGKLLNPESLKYLPEDIRLAGVFVDADYVHISETIRKFSLDIVQLHGHESPDLCYRLKQDGICVIRAFNIKKDTQFKSLSGFIACTDFFLFDANTEKYGGSGQKFDWQILDSYDLDHPFFLSGGIGPGDAAVISGISAPSFYGIDLNSRFEIEPGLKDIDKLKIFFQGLRG